MGALSSNCSPSCGARRWVVHSKVGGRDDCNGLWVLRWPLCKLPGDERIAPSSQNLQQDV